ncbi:hypothetical protein [Thalassobacillus devorans]|nr:hypothetical protein [Thalassobacillus devorans]
MTDRRVSYYTRKVAEYGDRSHVSYGKPRRYERLLAYKRAMAGERYV